MMAQRVQGAQPATGEEIHPGDQVDPGIGAEVTTNRAQRRLARYRPRLKASAEARDMGYLGRVIAAGTRHGRSCRGAR